MIHEIQAKVLLAHVHQPEPWFGMKYNMNLYRGCQHQCIYCDSRSECYQIENFNDVLVKVNAIELLRKELPRKRVKGTIGTGSMNDPYMPLEAQRNLTGQALQVIAAARISPCISSPRAIWFCVTWRFSARSTRFMLRLLLQSPRLMTAWQKSSSLAPHLPLPACEPCGSWPSAAS